MAVIRGTDGADTLIGTDRNDNIYGYAGNDVIYGGAGSDNLFGNAGDDTLHGGDGDDLIVGGHGAGSDQLHGGAGADIFHYYTHNDSTTAALDTIHDFESGLDTIKLEPIDANSTNNTGGQGRKNISNDEFSYVTKTSGFAPGDLTLTYSYDGAGNVTQTILNGYVNNDDVADLTIIIKGYVDPATDIIF